MKEGKGHQKKHRRRPSPWVRRYLKKHNLRPTRINIRNAQHVLAQKRKKAKGPGGYDVSVQESAAEWQIIYGLVRVGGVYTLIHNNNNRQHLHLVITLAGNKITAVPYVYFDGYQIVWQNGWVTAGRYALYGNRVFLSLSTGDVSQAANSDLTTNAPEVWTANHRQRGCAHVYIKLVWDNLLFPEGLPEINFDVQGKAVYDPRTTSASYSTNAALVLGDYLMDARYGLGIPLADIDDAAWQAAANVCDQFVTKLDGNQERRYAINGAFGAEEEPRSIIEKMLSAMAGQLVYVGGKWKILAGAYVSPSISLFEGDFRGGLRMAVKASKRDAFNGIRGTYISAETNWEESDFPVYKNSYYKAQDSNIEVLEDIVLPFTTSPATCQRLAKLNLERMRQEIQFEALFSLKAYQLEPGETVQISYARFGWVNKVFEVLRVQLVGEDDENGVPSFIVRLHLKETASAVYDWNQGQETRVDLAPNTTLPDPFTTTAPTGLTLTSGTTELYTRTDGTIFSRIKVSWSTMSDFFVTSGGRVEVQYKKSALSDWSNAGSVPGDSTFTHILDVQDGVAYDVRVRAMSAINIPSSWAQVSNHTVVGKTAPPSTPTGLVASVDGFSIVIAWAAISDLDVAQYEIRVGTAAGTWESSTFLAQVRGTTFRYQLQAFADYTFRVKAIDTSGNYSTLAATYTLTIARPTQVTPSFTIAGPNVVLTWTASTGQFAVIGYDIYYGDSFGSATFLSNIRGLSYTYKVDWGGMRRFWVVARDVANNTSVERNVDVTIAAPSAVQNPFPEVIDNNVLLRWTAPGTGTLPIDHYKLYKGATFGGATLLGQVTATFAVRFESVAGTYVYWIVPYDTAGNAGTQIAVSAVVAEPPDFVLQDNQILDPATMTLLNAFAEAGYLVMPADPTETYANHFTTNGWTTWQDAIDAGATYYINNVPANAYAEKVIDYGVTISAMVVKFAFVQENIVGALAFNTKIGYSPDNTNYTTVTDVSQVFASNFRYVKVRIQTGTFAGNSGEAMGPLGLTYP